MSIKKLLILLLVILSVLSVAACSSDKDDVEDKDEEGTGDTDINDPGTDDEKPVYYTVSFDCEGIPAQNVEKGKKATQPTVSPEKNYYIFEGWFNGDEPWSFDTPVTADITLSPKWTAVKFELTYYDGDTKLDLAPSYYTIDSEAFDLPTAPAKDHYVFEGWYTDEIFSISISRIETGRLGVSNLYAKYTPVNYKVSYNLDGAVNSESNPATYTVLDEFVLSAPEKDEYIFEGWYTTATFDEGTKVESIVKGTSGDIDLYAKFSPVYYTVSFDFPGISRESVASGTKATAPASPELKGYEFVCWMNGDNEWSFDTPVTKDVNLTPSWKAISYTVTFMDGETVLEELSISFTVESDDIALGAITKEHYVFEGWYTTAIFDEDTEVESIAKGTSGNITLYAKLSPKSYTITYHLGGGTNSDENPESYTVLDSGFKFANPTRENYTFMGWYTSDKYNQQISSLNGKSGDLELYAKWEKTSSGSITTPEDTFH